MTSILKPFVIILPVLLVGQAYAQSTRQERVVDVQTFLSQDDGAAVSLEGIVFDVLQDYADEEFVFLALDCNGYFIYAYCRTQEPILTIRSLSPFIGRKVRVKGLVMHVRNLSYNRSVTLNQLYIGDLSAIQVLDNHPDKTFGAPEIDQSQILLHKLAHCGRRRTRGSVLARWQGNHIILKKANGQPIMVEFRDGIALPKLGEPIEVEGQPETDLYRFHLMRAIWRPCNASRLIGDTPALVPLERLFKVDNRFIINSTHYGQLITVQGLLKEFVLDENGQHRILLEENGLNIQIDCSDIQETLRDLEVGSLISATGVCVVESDFWRPTAPFPKVKRLFLVARTPGDVVVVRGPPWWTPTRLVVAVCLLAGVLVLIVLWNISLRVLVERRSREVIRAQERKIESELRVRERTRLAAELHDNTVQNLTAIAYRITAALGALGNDGGNVSKILLVAAKMLQSCRTNLRRCLWDLRSDALDEMDFNVAIGKTVEPVAGDARLSVRFAGRRTMITDTTAHAILNILRELVSNAAIHGQAKSISIAGEAHRDFLRFSVRDDGIGFDPARRPGQDDGHFGLDGIQERLEQLGGTLEIDSTPGKGTYVRITIQPPRNPTRIEQT